MYGKKKMQDGGKISKEMDMKEVIASANRTSKMEADANKKLMKVPSDKEKSLGKLPPKVRNKMGYKMGGGYMKKMKKGGKVSSGYKCSHNRLY